MAALDAEEGHLIAGTRVLVDNITSSIPWPMELVEVQPVDEADRLKIGGCLQGEVLHVRSKEPIRETDAGPIFLELRLTTLSMNDSTAADRTFEDILLGADPDMGLSYAWDALIASGEFVYHLHAGCTLAEEHFDKVADALERAVTSDGVAKTARCRCGGGCGRVDN